ncbi:glycogen/starch/alpha-glucan phosphorylase [Candidatus Riflebacteria bacterium]
MLEERAVLAKGMDAEALKHSFLSHVKYTLGKDKYSIKDYDKYLALAKVVWDRLIERWSQTQNRAYFEDSKRIYYLSMEFLIGRILRNAITNLGLEEEVEQALSDLGMDLEEIEELELEPGLGNGGLGRLAACFLDSMATIGLPAFGMGIRYVYGIFKQQIHDGKQIELPDTWLRRTCPWEIHRHERTVIVKFYGRVQEFKERSGRQVYHWTDTQDVLAVPYDVPIPGYKNDVVNTLKLWAAESTEVIDLADFQHGEYLEACEEKVLAENITKVLYPNDQFFEGKILRLKQQYFFSSASLQDIVIRYKSTHKDFSKFAEKIAIQLNDTHPAVAIPELMRIFMDEEFIGWDEAWDITTKVFSYTNHTLLPEALERWEVKFFEELLPRHLQIIYEINRRFMREVSQSYPGDNERLGRMSIVEGGDHPCIRMAFLAVVGSHTVNGVAEIHTKLLQKTVMKDFAEFYPGKFQNKTNGVTQRRWMKCCNPGLSKLISSKIGDTWITNLDELRGLEKYIDDAEFRKKWRKVKSFNKKKLAQIIEDEYELPVNMDSIFDVQIKRLHEYKRQLLNAFFIVYRYLEIKESPEDEFVPRSMIFGAKAAPGYHSAKLIIQFINSIGEIINNDPEVGDRLKVFFLPNYRVSLAEKIIPAADLSEQISTAGMEASGTGNMKLALNGALTIGTLDGANIEILELVGEENMFVFGMNADEVIAKRQDYNPNHEIESCPELHMVISLIESEFFCPDTKGLFAPLMDTLRNKDYFMVLADFHAYLQAQLEVEKAWKDKEGWTKKSIINVARCGKFSSDRTIREYARDIWGVKPVLDKS